MTVFFFTSISLKESEKDGIVANHLGHFKLIPSKPA